MLGKLIKNEFKANAHSLLGIYCAVAGTLAVVLISYLLDITWISALSTITLFALSFVLVVVTFVTVVMSYQRSLFGAQGYLSFSLPVKGSELIASKAITSFVWMLLSYGIAIALWIFIASYLGSLVGEDVKLMFKEILMMLGKFPSKTMIVQVVVMALITVFLQLAILIASIYFSLTLSNTRRFQHHSLAYAVAIFIVVYIIIQICLYVFTTYLPLSVSFTMNGVKLVFKSMSTNSIQSFGLSGLLFELVATVLLFFGTGKLMASKVNIK